MGRKGVLVDACQPKRLGKLTGGTPLPETKTAPSRSPLLWYSKDTSIAPRDYVVLQTVGRRSYRTFGK